MNKIGLHIINGWSGYLGHPALVKLVNVSPEYVREVRAEVGGGCLIIVRWTQAEQPLDNPLQRARQFVEWNKPEMLEMRRVGGERIAFEGFNEISGSRNAAYCAFEVERMRLLHELGLNAVVGNFSIGTPALSAWAVYRPMLQAMREGDLLGLHEYWVDTSDIDNRWHCGRWRLSRELEGVPIVVTECGRDRVENKGAAGWMRTCGPDEFVGDLHKYNALLEQSHIYGAAVFTVGGTDEWRPFNVTPVWPDVVDSYVSTPAPPIPTPRRPLPSDETATDVGTLLEKVRWFQEEAVRQLQDLDVDRRSYAMQIMYDLIDREDGLLYRAERAAKHTLD